jgi:hypothetical protein
MAAPCSSYSGAYNAACVEVIGTPAAGRVASSASPTALWFALSASPAAASAPYARGVTTIAIVVAPYSASIRVPAARPAGWIKPA